MRALRHSRFFSSSASSSSSSSLHRTALYDLHKELGGKMVAFCGYSLPVEYKGEGINLSCLHTRDKASLFDTSHMGQLRLRGKDRVKLLELLTVGDIKSMKPNDAKLTLFLNSQGGILDDSIVTVQEDYIHIVVNAGCKEKDIRHIQENLEIGKREGQDLSLEILTDHSLVALQGPLSMEVLQTIIPEGHLDLKNLMFMKGVPLSIGDIPDCTITRCGYTGEDGFEISVPSSHAESFVRRVLSHADVKPAGLGARDALRLESGLCLYGHDCDESISPIEASLLWTIGKRRREEGGFLGADVIKQQIKNGVSKRRVGFIVNGAPAREDALIFSSEESKSQVGRVTSGTISPVLKKPIAMGYVNEGHQKVGTSLFASVRNKLQPVSVVKMPFVPQRFYRGTN